MMTLTSFLLRLLEEDVAITLHHNPDLPQITEPPYFLTIQKMEDKVWRCTARYWDGNEVLTVQREYSDELLKELKRYFEYED